MVAWQLQSGPGWRLLNSGRRTGAYDVVAAALQSGPISAAAAELMYVTNMLHYKKCASLASSLCSVWFRPACRKLNLRSLDLWLCCVPFPVAMTVREGCSATAYNTVELCCHDSVTESVIKATVL
jgi:hypothetical protein